MMEDVETQNREVDGDQAEDDILGMGGPPDIGPAEPDADNDKDEED